MSKKENSPLLEVSKPVKSHYFRRVRKNITMSDTSYQRDYETPFGVSETVPDQSIDLRLMLNRARSGQMVPHQDGVYHEQDLPGLYKMDDVELMQYRLDLATDMAAMSQQLHDASKALEQKQADASLEAAIAARLKDEKSKPTEEAKP